MPRAVWNETILAESDATVIVEGNHYFPASSLRMEHFRANSHRTRCPWKGEAHYYDVVVDDKVNESAAWYYPDPLSAASNIKDRVAFWKGVLVID